MTNFDTAREALDTSLNSAGSAMREHEKWQQSLEAQINKLKSSWQGLSQAFLKSDFLHGALDAVINLVDGLTKLIDTFGALPTILGTVAAGFSLFKNKGLFTFDKQSQSIQLFGNNLLDLKDKYAQIQTAIGRYNSLSSKSAAFQAKYNQAMANSSSSIGKYLSGLNGAKASMGGYITSLIGAKAATIGLQIATTALNAAMTMGISMLVSWAIEGVMKLVNADKELAEQVEELTSKFREQHDELQKLRGDYDSDNESSMISKYEKLSKGVDNLGRNVSLTADEYSEYQSIVNKIAEQIPSLVSGYDSQGNALLSVKGNVEELTDAYEKLIHSQNQSILTKSGVIEKDFKKTVDNAQLYSFWEHAGNTLDIRKLWGDYSSADIKGRTVKYLEQLLDADEDETSKILGNIFADDLRTDEVRKALMDSGVEIGFWDNTRKSLEKTLKDDPQKIKNIIDNYYAQFADAIEEQKTIAQAKLSEAFDVSEVISGLNYSNISEDLQAIARQTVANLDFDFFTELQKQGKTVEQWTKEMLDGLNAIGKENSDSITAAFDLQTQFNGGEISYGEYVKGLEDTGDLIERLNLKPELESQLKLSLGLDEDGLVAEYHQLRNRLASNEYFDIKPSEYAQFIESLSSEELSVLVDIIPELEETDYKETIADVKAALEKEMMLQGLTFDLNLEVEAAGLEALNTALAESVSATGLSSESIAALKGRYADLEARGYDLSSMFEETSTGIRLNRQEFNKLENAYATDKLAEVDGELTEMKTAYDDLGEAIKNCDDPIKKSELYNDRQTLAKRISEAATLAHQYKGLTNAYNDWLKAEEAGQERDMYENIIKGFETVDDEISRGWIDDGAIEFLELLTGRTDLAGKSGKQLKEIYDGLDDSIKNTGYSIRDFFTVDEDGNSTNTGVYNFLDAIGQLEEEEFGGKDVVKRDKGGNIIGFDFELAGGDEVIAEALGVSEELVQIMVRAADDAGFVVSMDGTYRQLADLQNEAKAAADYLHEIGKTDFEFDFNTTSVESLKTQLEEAHKILDDKKFWNKDGTFNFNADGATQAMQVVSTLQAKLDKLTEDKYGIGLTVEDEEFEEPLENLQDYGRKVATLNQLELNPKANADEIEELKDELEDIAKYFAGLDGETKVELGLDADDDWEEVKKKIENGEVKIPTVLDIQANMDKNIETLADLALLGSGLLSTEEEEVIEKKYKIDAKAGEVDASDVENKVENAVIDGLGNPILSREANIEIIAKTFGIEDVDGLSTKLEGLDDKTVQAIAEAVGKGDVDALQIAVDGMDGNTVQAVAEALGYSDVETLKAAVRNMKGNEVDAKVNTDGQAGKVSALQTAIDGLTGTTVNIVLGIKKAASSLWSFVTGNKGSTRNDSNGYRGGRVNGTANVDGTTGRAFARGNWRTKKTETALTGELGQEIVVTPNNQWYTVGDSGAEFTTIPKGSIVFNHKQTEELFKYGKVTSGGGRAKALANGTAFSSGSGGIGKASVAVKDGGGKTTTKTTTKKKKDTTTTTTTTTTSSGGSSGSGGGTGKADGSAVGTSNDKFDFIEIAISRIERSIDKLDKRVNNTYNSWSSRNNALGVELGNISREITLQQNAYDEYMAEANKVGLDKNLAQKVRSGSIDISTLSESDAEKVKNFQTWYEKAIACKDAVEDLKVTEASLYEQRFENIQAQYDGILQGYEHTESMLNEYISQAEAKGHIVSKKYYEALIDNERNNISALRNEQSALIAARDQAVASGKIKAGSQAWHDMCAEIDGVTQAIEEGETAIIEYGNSIRDIDWQVFDLIQEQISDITAEADFLIELMSNDKLFDDNGKLTDKGMATMGLHGQNYNTYMYAADEYAKQVAELDKQIEKDPYDQELINRRRELVGLQRDSILAAEDEKQAIKDLVSEGIEKELDALQERIDLHNEELDSMKDLYDYQKNVEEQTKNIASLQKQLHAYEGFNDEETRATVQKLKVELESAQQDLQETEYDKYIADQSALLDELFLEYENVLNTRLDDVDALITQVIDAVNIAAGAEGTIATALSAEGAIAKELAANGVTIKSTIEAEAKGVGSTLSSAMNNIWSVGEGNAKSVLEMYGKGFQDKQTTTNAVLGDIKAYIGRMVDDVDKDANKKVASNKTTTSAKKDPTKTTTTTKPTTTKKVNSSVGDGVAQVGDKVKFLSGKYYYDSQGVTPAGSKNQGKQVYITKINTEKWATHPYHISTSKTLGHGDLGWLKLSQIVGYASGKKNILNNEMAWTQENGQEYIIRPSDGAILTPIAKGDSVLNAQASSNIFDMANSPAEFIKDNLNFGATNVPNNSNVQNNIVQNLDKVVFNLPNVKNYDELLSAMQKDKSFEKLILSMTIDQIAGKSSLAKGKSIR